MQRSRLGSAAASLLLATTAMLIPVGSPPAAATRPAARISDVNGDGVPDIVYAGSRSHSGGDGQIGFVDVVYGNDALAAQEVTNKDLGDGEYGENGFGSAVLTADLNRDGRADVLISDSYSHDGIGQVWVLWGSATGVSAAHSTLLISGAADQKLGKSLAFVPLPTPVLAVGSDERTGGAVRLYPVNADGSLGTHTLIGLNSRGIAGAAVSGTGFADRLAASDDILVIGAPGTSVAGHTKAGAVHVLRLLGGLTYQAVRITQNTAGVAGTAEKGDQFGFAVSVLHGQIAVGVPYEKIGTKAGAGMVQTLRVRSTSSLQIAAVAGISQATTGVPGTLGRNDWFGISVTVHRPCDGAYGVLIPSPGDGRVTGVPFKPTTTCRVKEVTRVMSHYFWRPIVSLRTSQTSTVAESFAVALTDGTGLIVHPDGSTAALTLPNWHPGTEMAPAAA